ncbi:MAG: hypothetical protein WA144_16445 [Candidatus Methanoperedens sp.]
MRTKVYKVGWLWDTEVTSWDSTLDYSQVVSGLTSSETYYAVWDMMGTGGVQYGWLKFY